MIGGEIYYSVLIKKDIDVLNLKVSCTEGFTIVATGISTRKAQLL